MQAAVSAVQGKVWDPIPVAKEDLLLERAYRWEKERANETYLVQPMGGGQLRSLTWAEAMTEARKMATHLKGRGFPPGSRIAILAKNSAHFIIADLAIWMAGYISVALYPTLTPDTIKYILEHSDSKLIFIGKLDGWSGMKPGVPQGMPRIGLPLSPDTEAEPWDRITAGVEPISGSPVRDANDTAILMYTSGSTGRPKGVEHSFRSLSIPSIGAGQVITITSNERMISYLPLAHAFERALVESASIFFGFKVFFAESLDTFVSDVQRARPTIFHSVPRLWMKFQAGVLAKLPQKKLSTFLKIPILSGVVKKKVLKGLGLDAVKYALTGSAPLPPQIIAWYRGLGLELLEGYGMTENFCYSHIARPGALKPGHVGPAQPGVEVRIAENGEILVKSPVAMKSYYLEPALTAEAFTEDGYLKTGDRGEVDANGQLKITGRVKELFKTSKGKYVAPAPIENLLNASGVVEQSCVMGADLEQPLAVVMLNAEARAKAASPAGKAELEAQLSALLKEVNSKLPPYEHLFTLAVAKEEWTIPSGLLTPTLKIKRDAIERHYDPLAKRAGQERKAVCWE